MSVDGVKGLFIDFGRLAENEGRNKSGTGLGLSICKQIIEKMGGSVDVKSQLGIGTQFIIDLKVKCKVKPHRGEIESSHLNFHNFPFIYKNKDDDEYQNLMPNDEKDLLESQIMEDFIAL